MAQESEIRYLTPPSVDTKRKKYSQEVLERAGQDIAPPNHRNIPEVSAPCGSGR